MPTYEERKNLFEKYAYEIAHQTGSRIMTLGNQISPKVKQNAMKKIMPGNNQDEILGFMDTTVLGSGKNGYLFMEKHLYYLDIPCDPVHIRYEDITNLDLDEEDEDQKSILYVEVKEGDEYKISSPFLNKTPLYKYLKEAMALEKGEGESASDLATDMSVDTSLLSIHHGLFPSS